MTELVIVTFLAGALIGAVTAGVIAADRGHRRGVADGFAEGLALARSRWPTLLEAEAVPLGDTWEVVVSTNGEPVEGVEFSTSTRRASTPMVTYPLGDPAAADTAQELLAQVQAGREYPGEAWPDGFMLVNADVDRVSYVVIGLPLPGWLAEAGA